MKIKWQMSNFLEKVQIFFNRSRKEFKRDKFQPIDKVGYGYKIEGGRLIEAVGKRQ